MQEISAFWLYLIIALAGGLQAWGPPMNGALRNSLTNPWLASFVSFIPAAAFFGCLWLCQPRPLTTTDGLTMMPWWAPLGGLVGAFAVVAGLAKKSLSSRAVSHACTTATSSGFPGLLELAPMLPTGPHFHDRAPSPIPT